MKKRKPRRWSEEEIELMKKWILENKEMTGGDAVRELRYIFLNRSKSSLYYKWYETKTKLGVPSINLTRRNKSKVKPSLTAGDKIDVLKIFNEAICIAFEVALEKVSPPDNRRITELEQENVKLKSIIHNLTKPR